MNYREASKTPKCGWKYADDEQMLAALSGLLARHLAMRADAIFRWAKKHSTYGSLHLAAPGLIDRGGQMELLCAVLNDEALPTTRKD